MFGFLSQNDPTIFDRFEPYISVQRLFDSAPFLPYNDILTINLGGVAERKSTGI